MKTIFCALGILFCINAKATSIPVIGPAANQVIDSLVSLGFGKYTNLDFFQSGLTACTGIFDDKGGYFPGGIVGDYIGERCLIYGDADDTDSDGALRAEILTPPEDRDFSKNPVLKKKMQNLRSVRIALENLVQPMLKTVDVGGQKVIVESMVGISGFACDGVSSQGVRLCVAKVSHLCPPRN